MLLGSAEEEIGLADLFQEAMEDDAPATSEPKAAVARKVKQQPVDANLAGLFAELKKADNFFDDTDSEDLLGGLFSDDGTGNVEMDDDDVLEPPTAASDTSPLVGAAVDSGLRRRNDNIHRVVASPEEVEAGV